MNNDNLKEKEELRQRVIALLTREQIDFLDKLGKDARFSTGKKLTHTKIISYLIDILMRLGVDGKALKTSYDLEEKIKNSIVKSLISKSLAEPISLEKFNFNEIKKDE